MKTVVALAVLLVALMALAGSGREEVYTPSQVSVSPRPTQAQLRVRVLQDRLDRCDRGIAVLAERVRAGQDYDREAARILLHEKDLLAEMIEVEQLKAGQR